MFIADEGSDKSKIMTSEGRDSVRGKTVEEINEFTFKYTLAISLK